MGYMFILVIFCIIIWYNCNSSDKVDGVVIILLYNFLEDGGFKYNFFYGGLVDSDVIK